MSEKRFYDYGGIDLIFYPIANKLTPIFLYLKFSANSVTLLSGFIGIFGAICLSSDNKLMILLGSFGYIVYYTLDYIDGNIARKQNASSISGMFLDMFMGSIVAISTSMALYLGGRQSAIDFGINHMLLNTIGIIYLTSTLILNTRFAYVWLTIGSKLVEERYQKKNHINLHENLKRYPRNTKIINKIALSIFHENFIIFWLPIMGILNFLLNLDLRFFYSVLSVFILFPACVFDVYTFLKYNKINEVYTDIFNNAKIINPIKTIYLR